MYQVGVRELRQNASLLLDRVVAGESVEITNHGHPVARLVPIDNTGRSRQKMIEAGDLQPGLGRVLDVLPVEPPKGTRSTDQLLAELREE